MTRVALLHGGQSAEREVSLVSGRECGRALRQAGYKVEMIDTRMPVAELVAALTAAPRPDVVFNALHGRWGEDGTIQGLLALLGLPCTHSGVLASSLAMDKIQAKRVLAAAGVPVAEDRLVDRTTLLAGDPLPRPYVIKPSNEGSSVGVFIIREETNWQPAADDWPFGDAVMVEPYIPGREVTVAVMEQAGGTARALAVTEIVPKFGFYDYNAKYTQEKAADHIIPAPLSPAAYAEALRLAEIAHRALGCRGVSRADLRYDDTLPEDATGRGRFVMLEVNTQPGMTPMSLVPEQARLLGMSFSALCAWLVEAALGTPAPAPAGAAAAGAQAVCDR